MNKRLFPIVIALLTFLFQNNFVGAQTFKCYIANDHLVSSTQYELDVYIVSTSVDFNLRSIQNSIVFNPAFIPAGSTIVSSLVAGSTQLTSYNVGNVLWSSTGNGFQSSANTGVTCQTGTLITTATPLRVGTFRLVSSLPFNCAPSTPTMIGPADPLPTGIALRMAVTKWNSTDCSVVTNSTISPNGTYSQFPNSAYENVINNSPVIVDQPDSAANCSGSGFATFSVTANGAPGVSTSISYQWFENGSAITNGSTANGTYSGASTSTLTITNPGAALNGKIYTCVLTQCGVDTTTAVTLTVANSNDNNVCTIDACDPVTGALTHTPVNINDGNACTDDACDPVTGVSHTPSVINDNNVCTTDGCNPTTGVYHTPPNINDNDACTLDACDSLNGNISHTAINTNDNNACTTDGCNSTTGVYHTAVNVNDNNPCTNDLCDPLTGSITHTPVDVDDNDICTTDACSPVSGISHTPVNINDNNACTTDVCDPVTGVSHAAVNVNDNNACTTDACDPVSGVSHTSVNINDGNVCTLDACDSISGSVTHTNITPQAPVVTVTNNCGYSTLSASSPSGTLLWSTSETTPTINVTSSGTFTVTSTVSGCTGPAGSGTAAPLNAPSISLGNDTVLASGLSLVLDAGAGFSGYSWSTSATTQTITVQTSGIYSVTVTASNGCQDTDSVEVTFATGINPINNAHFELYPNPVKNSLFVKSNATEKIELINVYNSAGQKQRIEFFQNKSGQILEINTASLAAGSYTIEILTGGSKEVKQFIRQ